MRQSGRRCRLSAVRVSWVPESWVLVSSLALALVTMGTGAHWQRYRRGQALETARPLAACRSVKCRRAWRCRRWVGRRMGWLQWMERSQRVVAYSTAVLRFPQSHRVVPDQTLQTRLPTAHRQTLLKAGSCRSHQTQQRPSRLLERQQGHRSRQLARLLLNSMGRDRTGRAGGAALCALRKRVQLTFSPAAASTNIVLHCLWSRRCRLHLSCRSLHLWRCTVLSSNRLTHDLLLAT